MKISGFNWISSWMQWHELNCKLSYVLMFVCLHNRYSLFFTFLQWSVQKNLKHLDKMTVKTLEIFSNWSLKNEDWLLNSTFTFKFINILTFFFFHLINHIFLKIFEISITQVDWYHHFYVIFAADFTMMHTFFSASLHDY